LFKIKKKVEVPQKSNNEKLKEFVGGFDGQVSKLLTDLWQDEQHMDKTDLFLRNYIINERWKSSKLGHGTALPGGHDEMADEEDEMRSQEMDEYEANYNFRFQEPGADKIVQYPREVPESLRVKPQTRKEKRSKLIQRKKL
jgi:protein KRI1